jgi:excisionase family DNA binding protein
MIEMLETYSVKEAVKKTKIGEETFRKAIAAKELPVIRLGVRRIRIRPEALQVWLKSLEQGGKK